MKNQRKLRYSFILLLLVGCGVNKQLVETVVSPLPADTLYAEIIDTVLVRDTTVIKDTITNKDTVIISETKFHNRQIIKTVFEDRYRNKYLSDSVRYAVYNELRVIEKASVDKSIKDLKQKITDVRRKNLYLYIIIIASFLLFILYKFKWFKIP